MEEYLRLLADGRVSLANLRAETYEVGDAPDAYAALAREGPTPLLVVLSYPERAEAQLRRVAVRELEPRPGAVQVALVGAGSFAQGVHLPNLRRLDRFQLRAVVSRTGSHAAAAARRDEAAYATTDLAEVLRDPEVDLVLISTRHDTHARLALEALDAGKHVFVEKPLALTGEELDRIEAFYADREGPLLMTGFNRRFSPAIVRARELLAGRSSPFVADYRMNAGYIPLDHWVHGPEGGGRNIGEACHIYDVFDALTGAGVSSVTARGIAPSGQFAANDNFVATIAYDDGSVCTLTYTALGLEDHPKERMEIFADGSVLTLDDYKSLAVAGRGRGWRSSTQDKGHLEELRALGMPSSAAAPGRSRSRSSCGRCGSRLRSSASSWAELPAEPRSRAARDCRDYGR